MTKTKVLLLAIASLVFSPMVAQQKYEKVSVSYVEATTDADFATRTRGLEVEYYKNLHRWYGFSVNAEASFFNNIPNGYDYGTGNNLTANNIKSSVGSSSEWLSISQFVISSHFFVNFINNDKNFVYLTNGLGYNRQNMTYQNFDTTTYTLNSGEVVYKNSEPKYITKNTNTLVYLVGVGYDYTLPKNFTIGLNIRGQLPLVRNKDYFSTSGGYDELIRFGIKIGKKF